MRNWYLARDLGHNLLYGCLNYFLYPSSIEHFSVLYFFLHLFRLMIFSQIHLNIGMWNMAFLRGQTGTYCSLSYFVQLSRTNMFVCMTTNEWIVKYIIFYSNKFLTNLFTPSQTIILQSRKELLWHKETEKTLLQRKDNKKTGLNKTENNDWRWFKFF